MCRLVSYFASATQDESTCVQNIENRTFRCFFCIHVPRFSHVEEAVLGLWWQDVSNSQENIVRGNFVAKLSCGCGFFARYRSTEMGSWNLLVIFCEYISLQGG